MKIYVGDETPWGEAQNVIEYPHGVYWVDTAGHGGFLVLREYARMQMQPRHLKAANDFVSHWSGYDHYYAFEEDCAAVAVLASFPDIRDMRYDGRLTQKQCDQMFEDYYG